MRNAETVLGIIRLRRDTGEPGAPKGARPVRGGADGKVLTEQLASRLLYLGVARLEHGIDARMILSEEAAGDALVVAERCLERGYLDENSFYGPCRFAHS